MMTISNVIVQGLSILSSIRIAKNLKPELFGNYGFILSLASIYLVISSLGLRNIVTRKVAIDRISKDLFYQSLIGRCVVFSGCIVFIILYNIFFSEIRFNGSIIFLLCTYIFAMLLWDTLESISFGYEQMKPSAVINVLFTSVFVLLIIFIPVRYITLNGVFLLTVIVQVLKSLVLYIVIYRAKMLSGPFSIDLKNTIAIVKEAFPYYVLAIFTLFTSQIPIIYLEHFSNSQEIAFFNVSNRIISPIQMVLLTLLSSLYPNLSKSYIQDQTKFAKTVKVAFVVIFGAGVLGSLVISCFRKEIIHLLYGDIYEKSADIIAIQCWYTVLFGVFCLIGTILGAINKQNLISKLSFVYAAISFPCLFIGAKYGAVGLSIGFVLMALINMTYHLFFLQKSIPNVIPVKYYSYGAILYLILLFLSFKLGDLQLISKLIIFGIFGITFLWVTVKYSNKILIYLGKK